MRLIRDGEKGGKGYGDWGSGRLSTYRYSVTTRTSPAFRRAAMRAISMFQKEVMDKVTGLCPQTTTFLKRRADAVSNRGPSAYQPNALPLGQTGSRPLWLRSGFIYKETPVAVAACRAEGLTCVARSHTGCPVLTKQLSFCLSLFYSSSASRESGLEVEEGHELSLFPADLLFHCPPVNSHAS